MNSLRAAAGGLIGIGLLALQGCGGGYGGSSSAPSASVNIAVSPTSVTAGQSATITWSSTNASVCTASGAWSGAEPANGTTTVNTTTAGSEVFTLTCGGGTYGNNRASATLTVNAASAFSLTDLAADAAGGTATNVDANLVNPWGVSIPAGTAAAWIANTTPQTATLHDGNGKSQPQPAASQLVVAFAPSPAGTAFNPTGIVSNASSADFIVTAAQKSASSAFIFDGEGGMIAGWSPTVDRTHAVTMYTDSSGAVYKGLAIATNAGALFLYATDFHNNKIDVFNSSFAKQPTSATAFTFSDPSIPAGFAPFGIQAIKNGAAGATQIYVTYAKQQAPDDHDNTDGAGLGYVDIYDTNGRLVKQLVAQGALNAPWGLALAPADFGTFSGALLVGNIGDGKINAYDAAAGTSLGSLSNAGGAPIAIPGIRGIAFGNDANNQPHNTLFFAAAANNGADGVFGRIDLGATAPVLNAPPVVTLSVPAGTLSGVVALSATVTDPLRIVRVDFFANSTIIGSAPASPFTIPWDTTTIADGQIVLNAKATDADGNVGLASSTVTVANAAPPPPQVTLTQLQAQIFTPLCSGCHSGVGTSLPGVQNLSAGHTFASIVNVASIEQPTLKRISPNDATNSYLIQKIEGAAGISGSRMPLGCGSAADPCLDQPTIDLVKTWVAQGALNN
jgi:uncharacterized protein (TIGR03118 family)